MQYREIIIKSWEITKKHPFLNWLAGIPLALKFIIALVYLPLRIGLWFVPDVFEKAYALVIRFYKLYETPTIGVMIFFGVVFLLFLLVPAFCDGALIGTIGKIIHTGEGKVKKQFSIAYGLNMYFPLVELRAIGTIFNPMLVFIVISTLSHFNKPLFDLLFWPVALLFIFDLVITFSLIYANYELVIYKSGVFESIKKSMKLVLFNVTETFFIVMLLLLIVLRAIVNLLIVFIIPLVIYLVATYLSSYVSQIVLYILIAMGSLVSYYYALKTASMLSVFASTVLVFTFNELNEKAEHIIVKEKTAAPQQVQPVYQTNQNQIPQDALEIIGRSLLKEMEKISKESNVLEGRSGQAADVQNQLKAPETESISNDGLRISNAIPITNDQQDLEIGNLEIENTKTIETEYPSERTEEKIKDEQIVVDQNATTETVENNILSEQAYNPPTQPIPSPEENQTDQSQIDPNQTNQSQS